VADLLDGDRRVEQGSQLTHRQTSITHPRRIPNHE
jgi:hypothetical protein